MQGVLITNHYVRSEKFKALFAMLMQAADNAGIDLRRQTNFETLTDGFAERPDFVLFWDKDVRLARELERQGHRLFNSAAAIEACDDKSRTHTLMQKAGIRCPETVFSPLLHYLIRKTCCWKLSAWLYCLQQLWMSLPYSLQLSFLLL